eukprot:gene9111-biopygen2478
MYPANLGDVKSDSVLDGWAAANIYPALLAEKAPSLYLILHQPPSRPASMWWRPQFDVLWRADRRAQVLCRVSAQVLCRVSARPHVGAPLYGRAGAPSSEKGTATAPVFPPVELFTLLLETIWIPV